MLSETARRKHNKSVALELALAHVNTFSIVNKRPITALWTKLRAELTSQDIEQYRARCEREGKEASQLLGSAGSAAEVAENFSANGFVGVGLACGLSSVVTLDLDVKRDDEGNVVIDGVSEFMAIFDVMGFDLKAYPVVDTPSGGVHIHGYDPDGMATRHCHGFDLKARGGYVVAPGTYREDGGHYKPREGHPRLAELLVKGKLPRFPDWLLAHIRAAKSGKVKSVEEQAEDAARLEDVEHGLSMAAPEDLDPAIEQGFEDLAEDDRFLRSVIDGKHKSSSERRFQVAAYGRSNFGDAFTILQFRSFCIAHPECAGEYVQGAAKQGQFNDRNLARDFDRAPATGHGAPADFGSADEAPASNGTDPGDGLGPMTPGQIKAQAEADARAAAKKAVADRGIALPSTVPFRDLEEIPPTAWIVYPLYPRAVVGALIGPGGVAKSRLAVAELLAVVTGRPEIAGWPEDTVIERTSAWFHCQEDSLDEIDSRIAALARQYDVKRGEYDGSNGFALHRGSGVDGSPLLLAWRGDDGRTALMNPNLAKIQTFITERNIGLYAVDPIVELHELEENHSGDMRLVWGALRQIAVRTGAHILAIAHSRKADNAKSDGRPGDMNILRGSGAATGVVRVARTVLEMTEAEATELGVEPHRRTFYMRVDDAKNNLAVRRIGAMWFERTSVSRDGQERNNVGIVLPASLSSLRKGAAGQSRPARRLSGLAEAVRDAIRAAPAGQEHAVADIVRATPELTAKYGDDAEKARKSFKRDVFKGAERVAVSDGWLLWKTVKGPSGSTIRFEPGTPGTGDQTDAFGAVDDKE